MVQKYTYTKNELKDSNSIELLIDLEAYLDEISNWLAGYLIEHYFIYHS